MVHIEAVIIPVQSVSDSDVFIIIVIFHCIFKILAVEPELIKMSTGGTNQKCPHLIHAMNLWSEQYKLNIIVI